ncbi:MAG: hypothetical protein KC478_05635 [Bacteriovoracaceae bacterium]|nr:hypothetical protein [Bacteriovoracaceae bacterium]
MSRKKYLINKPFQLTIIGYFLALSLAAFTGLYAALTYYLIGLEKDAVARGLPESHVFFGFMAEQRESLNMYFLYGSLAVVVVGTIVGIYLSHKVAGPIYRLTKYLDENSKSKECELITFRKRDFFPELKAALNGFLTR